MDSMSLLICRKCKKIITSDTEPCPYCGEADPGGHHQVEAEPQQQDGLRNAGLGFFAFAVLLILVFEWFSNNNQTNGSGQSADNNAIVDSAAQTSCLASECAVGTKTVTRATIQDPFYLCKSAEFSEYANFVLSVMVKQARFADIAPEVSKSGEPLVQGDDKLLLDKYRAKAGVTTFEQAIAKCYRGRGNLKLVVLYSPKDSNSIYVAAEEDQEDKYWLPKARLFRR